MIAFVLGAIAIGAGVLFVKIFQHFFFKATGGDKPLDRTDNGRDDPARAVLQEGDLAEELTRSSFASYAAEVCPLHGGPFLGYVRFFLRRPGGEGVVVSRKGLIGRLSVLGCEKCFDDAIAACAIPWVRSNRAKHPINFSTQIYPHVVKDRFVMPERVFVAFDNPRACELAKQWVRSSDADMRAWGIQALEFRKSDETVALLKSLLNCKDRGKRARERVCDAALGQLRSWKRPSTPRQQAGRSTAE